MRGKEAGKEAKRKLVEVSCVSTESLESTVVSNSVALLAVVVQDPTDLFGLRAVDVVAAAAAAGAAASSIMDCSCRCCLAAADAGRQGVRDTFRCRCVGSAEVQILVLAPSPPSTYCCCREARGVVGGRTGRGEERRLRGARCRRAEAGVSFPVPGTAPFLWWLCECGTLGDAGTARCCC